MKRTCEKMLNSAEALFARQGYRGTTLRAVTTGAGVNLAAVQYHFGGKEGLLQKVLERRLHPLGTLRREALEAIAGRQRCGEAVGVEEILTAFIAPALEICDRRRGGEDFSLLVGRLLAEPEGPGRAMFIRLVGPSVLQLAEVLGGALPQLPKAQLCWRLHFCLGAMSHALCLKNTPEMRHFFGEDLPSDSEAILSTLIPFLRAGICAP